MSGGPGGGSPACVEKNYAGKFTLPGAADVLISGAQNTVSWFGGKGSTEYFKITPTQEFTINIEGVGQAVKSSVILDAASFTYGQTDQAKSTSWTGIDVCGNSEMRFNWTVAIPSDMKAGKFRLYAYNKTSTQLDLSNGAPFATSEVFLINNRAETSSTSSSTTTSGPTSSPTPTPTPTSTPEPTPDPGLSTGAKAGIGVGVSIGALLALLVLFLLWRRRRRGAAAAPVAPDSERFEKSELDASNVVKPVEMGGAERMELDGGLTQYAPAEKAGQQEPVELPGQDISRQHGVMDTRPPDRHH